MNYHRGKQNACHCCKPVPLSKTKTHISSRGKLSAIFGVCGCISCYIAMFPAMLLGIIGVFGLSQSGATSTLNTYMASPLFQPILIVSIIFLVAGIFPYGKLPLWLSILGGIGIFASMNFYMREWLFTFSFALVAVAYYFALRRMKSSTLKFAFILLAAVVVFGIIDIGRPFLVRDSPKPKALPQSMDAMNAP